MSTIKEQIKHLKELSDTAKANVYSFEVLSQSLREAADTIEALSAKLSAANEELKRWHTNHINEKIKNPVANTSTSICHNCDHKDEYIEELESAKGSGWIPCNERLPEENGYYQVTVKMKETGECFVEKKHYKIKKGWDNILTRDFIAVIAWQPLPQPYHEPSQADPPQAAPWKEHLAQRFGRVE